MPQDERPGRYWTTTWIVSLTASLTAAVLAAFLVLALTPLVNRTIIDPPKPSAELAMSAISRLQLGLSLENFSQVLGVNTSVFPSGPNRRVLWVRDVYAVDARVDSVGQVLGYSVTTFSSDFSPPLPLYNKLRLGKARFSDLPRTDSWKVDEAEYVKGGYHTESIGPDGSTNFVAYAFTASDASTIGLAKPRATSAVTTYSIYGESLSAEAFGQLGPSVDEVGIPAGFGEPAPR